MRLVALRITLLERTKPVFMSLICGHCPEERIGIILVEKCMTISGGSRIPPRWGRQLSRGAQTYDFAKISQKLHELKEFGPQGGGGASKILL